MSSVENRPFLIPIVYSISLLVGYTYQYFLVTFHIFHQYLIVSFFSKLNQILTNQSVCKSSNFGTTLVISELVIFSAKSHTQCRDSSSYKTFKGHCQKRHHINYCKNCGNHGTAKFANVIIRQEQEFCFQRNKTLGILQ